MRLSFRRKGKYVREDGTIPPCCLVPINAETGEPVELVRECSVVDSFPDKTVILNLSVMIRHRLGDWNGDNALDE